MCTSDGNAMNAMTSEAIHTTHCKYTDYSIIVTGSRSACFTFLVLAWFGPPHTHTFSSTTSSLPNESMPPLNPLPSASLDPSVERFQALGNVWPRDENLWQTLKTTDLWGFGSQLGQHQGKVSGAHHDIISAPKLEWMMTPRIQDTRTTESVMKRTSSFTTKQQQGCFTFQNWV